MMLATVILAALSLVVSATSMGLSLFVMRQSGGISRDLLRHRLGHQKADGKLDPAPHTDRRQVNVGPPRSTGERRASPGQLLPPEDLPPAVLSQDETPTGVIRAVPHLPRPGQIGKRT